MRILHASPAYAPAYELGGPIRSLEGLVTEQHRQGLDVRVLATDSRGYARLSGVKGRREWKGVPVRYLRTWLAPDHTPLFFTHAALGARWAEVVHVLGLFSSASMQAVAAAEVVGCPVVLSPRGVLNAHALVSKSASKKRVWLRACAPLLNGVSIFHATSKEESEAIRAVLGDVTVRVVPNGTSIEPWAAVLARKRSIPKVVVGAVGRIHPIKAYDRLIQAAALLKDHDFEVHMVGPTADREHLDELVALATRLGIGERVRFLGALAGDDLQSFYASCRLVVLPSHSENFGNVVVEALAAGTTVVASRHTPWEILAQTGAGQWVDNTPSELAAAIGAYLNDANRATRSGELGRKLVEERFSWTAVARQMDAVYNAALGATPSIAG